MIPSTPQGSSKTQEKIQPSDVDGQKVVTHHSSLNLVFVRFENVETLDMMTVMNMCICAPLHLPERTID
jgi:hypothetical protein